MRSEFLCISVLRVASGPRVKLASCKSALNPSVVCSTDRSKAVVPVLVLLFVALWFILRGDLLYVFPCVILFLCFSVLLVLRLPRLGKRELILVLFVRLFGLCLFRFVGFLLFVLRFYGPVNPMGSCRARSVSSSSWGLGRAAACDCGTPWTFLLFFFMALVKYQHTAVNIGERCGPWASSFLGLINFLFNLYSIPTAGPGFMALCNSLFRAV